MVAMVDYEVNTAYINYFHTAVTGKGSVRPEWRRRVWEAWNAMHQLFFPRSLQMLRRVTMVFHRPL